MAARKRKQKKLVDQAAVAPVSTSVEAAQPPAWQVAGAAVKGVSHQRMGLPCQDAQGYRQLPDGTLLVALADGAGSARFSDQGARRAVEAGLDALERGLVSSQPERADTWEELLREAFAVARQAVLCLPEESASEDGDDTAPARAYASTLTLTVAAADWLAAGQIGDGAVVAVMDNDAVSEGSLDGHLFAVTHLQRGEYANETHFLTQDDALDRLTVDVVEQPVSGFAVMSDGLIRLALKMPGQEPHAPFFAPLFRFAGAINAAQGMGSRSAEEQLAAFLDSERVNARTDDDKSLVLAVRVKEAQQEAPAGEPPNGDRKRE